MARVHPGNLNSRVPDHQTIFDHVTEHLRNQDFETRTCDAANPRGGGGGGGRGRGRGRGGGVRTCFGCGELGHIIRDCPATASFPRSNTRRGNQAFGNDPSNSDAIESTSGTSKYTLKPLNAFTPVDITPLLSKIRDKEQELKLSKEQNADLNMRLNKTTKELTSVQTKNEEMVLNMNTLKEDLEKIRKELSSAREKETVVIQMYSVMKNKFEELEDANEAADTEIEKLKSETEQWRKAAKAIAVVFNGGEVISSKTPELESLVLYYSNRAVKRMSLGKTRKALDDCRIATKLDPSFLKVSLTAGNCYLKLGELDDAIYNYKKCLESGAVCLDRRLTIEASEGLQNAQKVVSCIKQSAELLQQKTSESAMKALDIIMEVSLLSSYSEKLLEMKVEAFFLLKKYDQVIQLCEKSLPSAESNCAKNHTSYEGQISHLKLWRWRMMARCYFRMGNFDLALVTLEKYEQLSSDQNKSDDPSSFSAATVSELLRCKSAGNEAYKSGRHKEAIKHYTKALQMSIESKSFAAICLCNRAAAHQALGEVIDAIADCNLAIALDNNYLKAISRRANLHEKIRDYEHASLDLHRLITLLEKKSVEKQDDLTIARRRLSSIKKHLKKEMTLDLYLILGLKGSESGAEIKKAYHKAALRHHPDKAGKFLTRCESGEDGGVWKEIYETIHKDADKLFKIIGEAYAVLSDVNKRFKYNLEDAMDDDFQWPHVQWKVGSSVLKTGLNWPVGPVEPGTGDESEHSLVCCSYTSSTYSRRHQKLQNKLADLNAEFIKMKIEKDQWRKAAKTLASVVDGGAEISSKTPELESVVFYYSNRAVKRMSLGKMRKALDDCRMATLFDPSILKVYLTTGNCHLVLGELDDAIFNYKKCSETEVVVRIETLTRH
ncbi:hypothetical protein LXL04_018500 [Taraxacum kok-saghyz]